MKYAIPMALVGFVVGWLIRSTGSNRWPVMALVGFVVGWLMGLWFAILLVKRDLQEANENRDHWKTEAEQKAGYSKRKKEAQPF